MGATEKLIKKSKNFMLCSVLVNIDQQKKVMKHFAKYLKKLYSQI